MGEGGGMRYNPDKLFNTWYKAYGHVDRIDGKIYECEVERKRFEYLKYCMTLLTSKDQEILRILCIEWQTRRVYAKMYNINTNTVGDRKRAALLSLFLIYNDKENLAMINGETAVPDKPEQEPSYSRQEFHWKGEKHIKFKVMKEKKTE